MVGWLVGWFSWVYCMRFDWTLMKVFESLKIWKDKNSRTGKSASVLLRLKEVTIF